MKKLLLFLLAFTGSVALNASDRSNNTTPTSASATASSGYQSTAASSQQRSTEGDFIVVNFTKKPARPHSPSLVLQHHHYEDGELFAVKDNEDTAYTLLVPCVITENGQRVTFDPIIHTPEQKSIEEYDQELHPWMNNRSKGGIGQRNLQDLQNANLLKASPVQDTYLEATFRTVASKTAQTAEAATSAESLQHAVQQVTQATAHAAGSLNQGFDNLCLGITSSLRRVQALTAPHDPVSVSECITRGDFDTATRFDEID